MDTHVSVFCFLLLIVGAFCINISPAKEHKHPPVPASFHAGVHATFKSAGVEWVGGGLFVVDAIKGISRTDLLLINEKQPKKLSIHTLDRYDLQTSFVIDAPNYACTKTSVAGAFENPLAWMENATHVGLHLFTDTWEFTEADKTYHRISVSKETQQPLNIFTRRYNADGSVSELEMKVLEWNLAVADWVTYVPASCTRKEGDNSVGDVNGVVYFANNNWNCADVACSQRVPAGTGQPNYACAEFTARSLAYGGFIPNLGATDPQGSYYSYVYNSNKYDLCWVSSLSDALGAIGFTQLSASYSSVDAGVAVMGDGGDGAWSHAVIGVGPQTVDAHNNARLQIAVSSDLFNGVQAAWAPSGSGSSSGSGSGSGSSSASSYYSAQMEAKQQESELGGNGAVLDLKSTETEKISTEESVINKEVEQAREINDLRIVEEKTMQKF